VPSDWYVESIGEIERAAQALHDAVERTVGLLRRARADRLHGTELVDIVGRLVDSGGKDTRRKADEAFARYAEALASYRTRTIRALVDDDGLSLADVTRLTGLPSQTVRRLYRTGT
jgi:hypothetical protein